MNKGKRWWLKSEEAVFSTVIRAKQATAESPSLMRQAMLPQSTKSLLESVKQSEATSYPPQTILAPPNTKSKHRKLWHYSELLARQTLIRRSRIWSIDDSDTRMQQTWAQKRTTSATCQRIAWRWYRLPRRQAALNPLIQQSQHLQPWRNSQVTCRSRTGLGQIPLINNCLTPLAWEVSWGKEPIGDLWKLEKPALTTSTLADTNCPEQDPQWRH